MDVASLGQAAYLTILKRLQGSGYASDDSSNRVKELNAIAKMAALASEAVNAASRNLFLSSADEALDLLEAVRFLIQDAALTDTRRRARLLAFARAAKLVIDRLTFSISQYVGASTGVAVSSTALDASNHVSSAFGGMLFGWLDSSLDKQEQRDIQPLLRGLPARAIAGGVCTAEAEWGAAIGASIAVAPDQNLGTQSKTRVAPFEFYPGSIIGREQWIEIQSMLCFKSRGFSIDQDDQGRWIFYEGSIAATTTTAIDGPAANGGVDWRDRFVQAWGTITTTAVLGNDTSVTTEADNVWLSSSKTGVAAVAHSFLGTDGSATGVTLFADAANGDLKLNNTNGATRWFKLMIRCSPKYTTGTSTDTQPWIDSAEMESADVDDMFQSQVVSGTTTPGEFAGNTAGAMRRIIYTGPLSKMVDADHVSGVIVDSSEDWRDRWVLVIPITLNGSEYVSANVSPLTVRNATSGRPRMFYTNDGVAPGSATAQPYQHPDRITSPNIWLFSDTSGALRAEMKSTDSANANNVLMALVIATEKYSGSHGVSEIFPPPVGATHVQTADLEHPQNCGVYAQGQQGVVAPVNYYDSYPRALAASKALTTPPTSPALGLISDGQMPLRPVSWLVRERVGATDDGAFEVRQRIYGQRRRIVSVTIAGNVTTPLDLFNDPSIAQPGVTDQMDFRDRFVWVEGRFSTTDIRISAAVASDAAATRFSALLYAGPTDDVTSAINADMTLRFEFERTGGFHSRLVIVNGSATTYYVNAVIETSGFLGLTDIRGFGLVS